MKKQVKLDANGKRAFGMRDCLAYAAGDLGCNMSFALKGTIQTFWLIYMTMETGLLSALLLVVQIWDAINDPVIGAIIDRDQRKYKMGKFKTYILIGAIGLLVAGALCFIPIPSAPMVIKAIIFVAGYIIWDACYTIANVPYGSMLSLVTDNTAERAQLSLWRSIGSMIGNMLPMVLLPFLIWKDHAYDGSGIIPGLEGVYNKNPITDEAYKIGETMINPLTHKPVQDLLGERMFWVALIMGVLGFIFFVFMVKTITLRVDERNVKIEGDKPAAKTNVFKSFGLFMKNRPAVGATLAAMAMFLGMNSATTATTVMFVTYFGKGDLSGVASVIGFLPMFIFMPFIKKIVTKYGKKEASTVGAIVSLVGGAMMFIFPLISNTTVSLVMYIVALSVFGIGMGIYTCVSWAMMADAIDYNEWKFGAREEGTVYSLHSFFRKLAQGVGPSVVLLLMGALGYVSKLGTVGQSPQTAQNMCWLVAGLYLFSAILQLVGIAVIYNLDKKTVEKMNAELHERREAQKAADESEVVESANAPAESAAEAVEDTLNAVQNVETAEETPAETTEEKTEENAEAVEETTEEKDDTSL